MAPSPYRQLEPKSFWSTGVAKHHPLTIEDLYKKKFPIPREACIATAGSCFAQHISHHLRQAGYNVLDCERPPAGLPDDQAREFGYRTYSARFGNIYLVRQLLQLYHEAVKKKPRDGIVWEKNGRFFDALRPAVEPKGLGSPEEVLAQRRDHLKRVKEMFDKVDVFIFTFGLTEGWIDKASGLVFPTCPGVVAGSFDPSLHGFKNFTFAEVYEDFVAFRRALKRRRPDVRFLLTVSPVPLKASASKNHVLAATTYSKSVLRAVAGQLSDTYDDVDYFPSYELVASPWSRGFFFEEGLREVNSGGVSAVMRVFSQEHPAAEITLSRSDKRKSQEQIVCEEELLGAFEP